MPMNNRQRADAAHQALLAYCHEKEGREELYDEQHACIRDLVCDLCHLVHLLHHRGDRKPLDLLLCAYTLFEDELAEEEPGLREALRLAIKALNQTPRFDTGIPDPVRPERTLSSYALIPQLEAALTRPRPRTLQKRVPEEVRPPWEDDS